MITTSNAKAGLWGQPASALKRVGATIVLGLAVATCVASTTCANDFGEWQIKRHTNPMDDSSFALVMIQSEANGVSLGLNCRKSTGDVGIVWGQFLSGEESGGIELKDITYRIDQSHPAVASWQVMQDGTTVRALTPEGFIRKIRDSSRLVLQVEPYRELPLTAVFNTKGLREALLATSPECDWFVRDILWERKAEQAKKEQRNHVTQPVQPAPFQKWTEDAATK